MEPMIGTSWKRIAWQIKRSFVQAKRANSFSRRVRHIAKICKGKPYVVLKCRPVGFYSMYFQALLAYQTCKRNHQKLISAFDIGPYYDQLRGEASWWSYYFEDNAHIISHKKVDALAKEEYVSIDKSKAQEAFALVGTTISRKRAHRLSAEILMKPEICLRIKQYSETFFENKFVIGIHYRGTDKVVRESVRVEYDLVLRILQRFTDENIPFYLFIATDEEQFLHVVKEIYGEGTLCLDVKRSSTDAPIHMKADGVSAYDLGLEALMDATLLSRCDFLLRCDSNLSQASLYFNPKLDFINISTLTRMYHDLKESVNEADLTSISRRIVRAYRRKKF